MKRTLYVFIFVCCCFFASFAEAVAGDSPENALKEIQISLDQANLTQFEQRVDVEGLATQGAQVFLKLLTASTQKQMQQPLLAMLAGFASTPENKASLQNLLVSEASNFVRDGVSSGMFGGHPNATANKKSGLLAPLFADASTGKKSIQADGKSVFNKNQNIAEIPVRIHDAGNDQTYRMRLRLEKNSNNLWKVTQIADIDQIAKRIWKE